MRRSVVVAIALPILAFAARPADACSLARVVLTERRPSFARLWLTALADTVYVGPWKEKPLWRDKNVARAPSSTPIPVYGQLFRVERVAEDSGAGAEVRAALERSGGRVLLVPHAYSTDCSDAPWAQSARWVAPGELALLVAKPRRRGQWIGGYPTFDVLGRHDPYPHGHLLKNVNQASTSEPWLTVPEFWRLLDLLPISGGSAKEREGALSALRQWAAENPTRASRFPANEILETLRIP